MKSVKFVGNQGDVCLFSLDDFPKGKRMQDTLTKNGQIALGEISGHNHAFADPTAIDLFKIDDGKFEGLSFFQTNRPAELVHGRIKGFQGKESDSDYHSTAKFDEGKKFMTGIVVETDWITKTVRRVID
jgi:hypothetical protein